MIPSTSNLEKKLRSSVRLLWRNRRLILVALGLGAVLVVYAQIQVRHHAAGCRETDTAGYFHLASRIADFKSPGVEPDPFRYHSHVWVKTASGKVVPKYAPGYPFLLAIGYWLGSERLSFAVSPICGGLTLIGLFVLLRQWVSSPVAILAAAAMVVNPMFMVYTNYPLSHAANMCFITWGFALLWLWMDRQPVGLRATGPAAKGRDDPGWLLLGAAAGLCLGAAVTVRPVSGLLVAPFLFGVAVVLLRGWRGACLPWKGILVALVAYGVPTSLLLLYNTLVFGSPFTTGYALSAEQNAFQWSEIDERLPAVVDGLHHQGLWYLAELGLLGVLLLRGWVNRTLLLLWVAPTLLLYTSYYYFGSSIAYLRLFLCLFPAFLLGGFALLDHPARWSGVWRWVVVGFLVFFTAEAGRGKFAAYARDITSAWGKHLQAQAADAAGEHLPYGAVVFAEPGCAVHLDRGKRFDLYNLHAFHPRGHERLLGNARAAVRHAERLEHWRKRKQQGKRVGDSPRRSSPGMQIERAREVLAFYQENGEKLRALLSARVREHLQRGETVALLVEESSIRRYSRWLGPEFTTSPIHAWTASATYQWRSRHDRGKVRRRNVTEDWALYAVRLRSDSNDKTAAEGSSRADEDMVW